ncbi:MAG TPA: FAD-linked oxidase C-terminal domain-containing protein, partial [Planctomycetota bacterium]|nr:FAD-linked oxidase C-terminal domain-containing protein [Planctomycetota bacterium]
VLRGGGTALDGEAVGDGVLIVARELRRMRRAEDGDVICGAGVGATLVDAALAAEGSCLGDDGADLMAARGPATIGGLIAGGARGLEVVALDLILADGLRLDTGADDADERLAGSRPGLVSELIALRTAARGDAMLCRRIREAAALGNGLGYRLDALIDGATPVAILHRLVIGSQGTLACIAGARLRPRRRAADRGATAWLAFAGVAAAVVAARALADAGAQRAEVFDAAALRLLGEPAPGDAGAGARLLVDWREDADAALDQRLLLAAQIVAGSILEPFAITRAPAQRRRRRQARLRLAALAGAAGAPPVVHDLALPPDRLRDAALRVRAVLDRHGWRDAPMTIGHAGSLRALVALDHGDAAARARHRAARDEIAAIVLAAGGCLAGADGTGRERADLVERQWGTEGLAFMRRVKRALDAHAILGPGVVVPDERAAAAIAPAPALPVSPAIDACTACGACEGACAPVADGLRARIARLRAMRWGTAEQRLASAQACGADRIDVRLRRAIAAGPCPLGIDDAAVAAVEHPAPPPRWRRRLADVARRNLAGIGRIAAVASGFALRLGDGRVPRIGLVLTPPAIGARRAPPPARGATVVVHVPSCVATATGSRVGDAIAAWCARSGHAPHPTTVTGLCCGGAFAVAGCADAAAAAGARCAATLRRMRDELPVGTLFVTDRASCAARVAASGFPLMVPPPRARFAAAGIPHMAPSEDDEAR